ncbi:MAG: formyl-CoA transferase [Rhodospirillales bacterium CG15_BIG_FIL_POST_REV_8_21_14_020_66_15]|nr:MAG: formyl-CoA transferase [Rhodospirillales bacterium CG15_BIG_FIL_POST_REV_8_21_14_020_66_15]
MAHIAASTALDHIKVLDLTRVRSGPTCVRQLADWGADVIKVELPESIEPDGTLGAKRHTADFQNLQRNKRSLTLNLKEEEGRRLFLRLVEGADVVIENFRPDVKDKLGIGYEALKAVNPRIILGSISGFGQDGPYAKRPGFDQIAQGMGGLMSITGEPGRGPMRVGIPVADLTGGLFCAMGVLIALIEREKSGRGQWVQSSLLQAMAFMLDFQAARYLMENHVPQQAGNDHPTSIPTGVFPTSDGHINIAAAGERIWQRLCDVLGTPEWAEDVRFNGPEKRSRNRHELNAMIAEKTKDRTSADWVDALNEAGVPTGPIYDMAGMFADEQVRHLGIAAECETVCFGKAKMMAQPIRMSRTDSKLAVHPPEKGEHTDEILKGLGLTDAELADLRSREII